MRNGVAPAEELLGCSWGLHDPAVAPLPVLTQAFRDFRVGLSRLSHKGEKVAPQAVGGLNLSWALRLKPVEGSGSDNQTAGPHWA